VHGRAGIPLELLVFPEFDDSASLEDHDVVGWAVEGGDAGGDDEGFVGEATVEVLADFVDEVLVHLGEDVVEEVGVGVVV
jgi:hypothetical protein